MKRLHGALNRATDGKAPILPPGVETAAGEGTDASQPGFSVPWTLDVGASARPGSGPDATEDAAAPEGRRGFISLSKQSAEPTRREGRRGFISLAKQSDQPTLPEGRRDTSLAKQSALPTLPGVEEKLVRSTASDAPPDIRPDATEEAAAPEGRRGFTSLAGQSTGPTLPDVDERLVGSTTSDGQPSFSVAVEQYRKLAAALHHAQADRGLKAIVVTSANPGEGKSLTASNLALTLSESYQRRVLLIDGDLRRPTLHEIFGVPNMRGLSDGLAHHSIQEIVVREISPRLSILPSGPPIDDPTGQLTSDQMKQVLDEARASYDWVIFDTPPIGLVSDAKLLSEMVDGVVLVVTAGKSGYPDLLRAVDTIGRERLLGVVLNRLQYAPGRANYYTSYYRAKASKD